MIYPKKRLGQHFLSDKNILAKIIRASALNSDDPVVEIGAGRGELTALLSSSVRTVYAIEVDKDLIPGLKAKFATFSNVSIIQADILRTDLRTLVKKELRKVRLIGNIPYNITTPLLEYLFGYKDIVSDINITVQKEFAARIAAACGSKEYGAISCFVAYHSCPKIAFNITRSCFHPQPKVDSSFLKLSLTDKYSLSSRQEQILFKLIRAAFGQRRKMLQNSLSGVIPEDSLRQILDSAQIKPDSRAESISLEEFVNLTKVVDKIR